MSSAPHSARHDRLSALFLQACDLPAAERETFLRQQCGDDPDLLREVIELLPYDGQQAIVDRPLVRLSGSGILEPADHPDPQSPRRIGQYEILGVLGQGGMGTVYRARQRHPDRVVALKVIQHGFASPATIRRFELEASLLGRLHHPGIAQIYEAGTADTGMGAQPYFAMELITGCSLLSHVHQHRLSATARLDLLTRICDAVQHAHQHGIVHRDLKPGNILVEEDTNQPRILDFGVARVTDADLEATTRHTRDGQLLGTLPYMSPEQLSSDSAQVDYRSDVYALGVIAYELLTGHLPHDLDGKPVYEVARIVHTAPVTRISNWDRGYRGDVETMIGKAMEKDPALRYSSAADFAEDIRRYLSDQPIKARPPSTLYQLRKFVRRNRALVIGTAVAIGLLIAAVIGTSYGLIVARGQRDEARRAADKAEAIRQFFLGVLATPAPGEIGRDVKVVDALLAAEDAVAQAFPDQPEIRADVHAEVAITLSRLGEFSKAESYAREALRIRSRTLGETHIDTIRAMNNLGHILLQQDGSGASAVHEEARQLLDRAIQNCQQHHADRPEELIDLLSNRAGLAFKLGQLDEAERLTRDMLDRAAKHAGVLGTQAITARQNLAVLLNTRGRRAEAELELGQVAESLSGLHGDRHPTTLKARLARAMALTGLRRYEEAQAIYEQNLPIADAVLGPNHVDVIRGLNNFAFTLKEAGRVQEGVDVYRDALQRAEASPVSDSFLTIVVKDSLGISLVALSRFDEAEPLLRDCVAALSAQRGPDDTSTLFETYKLVDVLIRCGRFDEAVELGGEQRVLAEAVYPTDSAVVAVCRVAAARALLAAERIADAREVVDACMLDCPPRTADEHYLVGQALQDLLHDCQHAGLTIAIRAR